MSLATSWQRTLARMDRTNVSEYIRDLVRRDKERAEKEVFDRLKAELDPAFAAPDSSYEPLTAAEIIARNRT